MADTLGILSIAFFIVAAVFAALAVLFWFVFRIPTVMGDLSGKTAKKSIEKMRKNNENIAQNRSAKKDSDDIIIKRTYGPSSSGNAAGSNTVETGLLQENAATFHETAQTGLLINNPTDRLVDSEETAPLISGAAKTERKKPTVTVNLINEITLIHTEEVI